MVFIIFINEINIVMVETTETNIIFVVICLKFKEVITIIGFSNALNYLTFGDRVKYDLIKLVLIVF